MDPTRESFEKNLFVQIMKELMFDIEKFKVGKTDKDRVRLVLSDIDGSFHVTSKCPYGKKSANLSEQLRYSGNSLLNISSPDLEEVLKRYSKSILYAPPRSEQLSLAYANRSAVLFRGKYYEECLEDINRALETGYPDKLKPKLLIRKVTCNYALTGNVDFEKDEALIEVRELIEKLPATNKMRKMVEDTLNNPERITSVERHEKKTQQKYQPEMKGRNPHLPGASDAIALSYSEEFGRHLVATRNINSGEILIIERPYVLTLPTRCIDYMCSHCGKGTWNGIPCDHCTHAIYCSPECKHAAWEEYHDVECELFPIIREKIADWNLMVTSLKMTVKAIREAGDLEALKKRLKELDSIKASDIEISINPNSYETFYIMADNPENYELEFMALSAAIASRLTYLLAVKTDLLGERKVGDLRMVKDSEELLFVASFITKIMRTVKSRAFGGQQYHSSGAESENQGIEKLLPVSSFLNSRCYDTAQVCRFNEQSILVTLIPFKKGDQIFINYFTDYKLTPRDLRRKFLKDQWQFDCNCLACTENWTGATATWDNRNSPKQLILKMLDEMKKVDWENSTRAWDAVTISPVKEILCQIIDFMYPRVRKPCSNIEEWVQAVDQIHTKLGFGVRPQFINKL